MFWDCAGRSPKVIWLSRPEPSGHQSDRELNILIIMKKLLYLLMTLAPVLLVRFDDLAHGVELILVVGDL